MLVPYAAIYEKEIWLRVVLMFALVRKLLTKSVNVKLPALDKDTYMPPALVV
jgi:hypothetical protein